MSFPILRVWAISCVSSWKVSWPELLKGIMKWWYCFVTIRWHSMHSSLHSDFRWVPRLSCGGYGMISLLILTVYSLYETPFEVALLVSNHFKFSKNVLSSAQIMTADWLFNGIVSHERDIYRSLSIFLLALFRRHREWHISFKPTSRHVAISYKGWTPNGIVKNSS